MMAAAVTRPTPIDEDVRVLVARAQAGDTDAYGAIYQRYRTTIYGVVYRRVGNPATAEDLTSEVFLRALTGIARFTWRGRDPIAWLVTIANNLVRDHFRSARQRLEIVSDDSIISQTRPEQSLEGHPDLAALTRLTSRALTDAIRQLTPAQQKCIVLRFFGGLSTAETAAQMGSGMTVSAVKSMQYRAVQTLADTLLARAVVG